MTLIINYVDKEMKKNTANKLTLRAFKLTVFMLMVLCFYIGINYK